MAVNMQQQQKNNPQKTNVQKQVKNSPWYRCHVCIRALTLCFGSQLKHVYPCIFFGLWAIILLYLDILEFDQIREKWRKVAVLI